MHQKCVLQKILEFSWLLFRISAPFILLLLIIPYYAMLLRSCRRFLRKHHSTWFLIVLSRLNATARIESTRYFCHRFVMGCNFGFVDWKFLNWNLFLYSGGHHSYLLYWSSNVFQRLVRYFESPTYVFLKSWNFSNRLPYIKGTELETLKDCLSCFNDQVGVCRICCIQYFT